MARDEVEIEENGSKVEVGREDIYQVYYDMVQRATTTARPSTLVLPRMRRRAEQFYGAERPVFVCAFPKPPFTEMDPLNKQNEINTNDINNASAAKVSGAPRRARTARPCCP